MIKQIQLLFSVGLALNLMMIAPLAAISVGDSLPACALTSLDGSHEHNLQAIRGKVIYVDFWASWCPPCVESFPFLNQLENDLKNQGLQVVAINLDEELADAQIFLDEYPADFAIALDPDKQCAQDFGVIAMPSSYLIDRKGVVRHVHHGFRSGDVSALRLVIESVLGEPL